MRKGKLLKATSLALAGLLVLSGCGNSASKSNDSKKNADSGSVVKIEAVAVNEGKEVEKHDPIVIGISSADPIKGQLNPVFYLDATDAEVMKYTMMGAFPTDEMFKIIQDDDTTMFKYHLDRENKKFTISVNKDLKWSNGEPVTSDDIIATYNMMGNPKFDQNIRYDEDYEDIVGMKEYHEGKADSISGMKKVDDKTVEIQLNAVKPSMLWGDGTTIPEFINAKQAAEVTDFNKFWEYPLNTKPLSYGPYYLEKNNGGESFLFKANPHYYKGEPKNKELKLMIVPPAQLVEKLKSGEVDIMEVGSTQYPKLKDLNNGKVVGVDDLYIGYIGFKLGKLNKEKGEVEVDPNAKLADKNLRKAMAMALDNDAVNKKFFNGIASTPSGSGFYGTFRGPLQDKDAQKIPFDVEGAKKLLDESGYKDVDGDGLREDKNGKKLVIRMAQRDTGNEIDEPLSQFYIQSFKNIGLEVKLTDDKLMGVKDFSQRVQADDANIDIYVAAWGLGSSPNPSGLLGKKSPLNWYRYSSENLDKALELLGKDEMFDNDKLIKAYHDVDKIIAEEMPYIPVRWTKKLMFVNNRIGKFDSSLYSKDFQIDSDKIINVSVLAEKGIAAK